MSPSRRSNRDGAGPRTEPTVGDLGDFDATSDKRRVGTRSRRTRGRQTRRNPALLRWLLVILVVLAGALVWTSREEIRSLLPSTELNQLLERAGQALAAGRLNGAQGNSARELYSAALALAPDNDRARKGLERVGEAQFERAQAALDQGDLQTAAGALRQARALLGGGAKLDALAQDLARIRGRNIEVAVLIDRANQALAEGRLDGSGGASTLYRQVLKADPDNAVAEHGLDKVGADYADKIRSALRAGDLEAARDLVRKLTALLPDFGQLPALHASVAQARRDAEAALKKALAQAHDNLQAGRLVGEGEDNALARYQRVLATHPNNAAATDGIRRVAAALLQRARVEMEAGRTQQARVLIDQAAKVSPGSADVASARSRLAGFVQADNTAAPSARLDAAQQAKVQQLVLRAQAASSAGDLMLPPGTSAYDLYRAALAIDPDNTDALAGLAGLPGQARRLFDTAMQAGQLETAGELLEAFAELLPSSSSVARMQSRLVSALLDEGAAFAEAGNAGAARKALLEARQLAPNDPRIKTLLGRLGN